MSVPTTQQDLSYIAHGSWYATDIEMAIQFDLEKSMGSEHCLQQ